MEETHGMHVSSGRDLVLAELAAYVAATPGEAEARRQIRTFIASHDDCFERSRAAGHVTGSAWVVDRCGRFALLTHHRKLDRWLQLGGHADGDPDIRAVALREATEESGLRDIAPAARGIFDLDVHPIPARGSVPEHVHYDIRFAFFANSAELPIASDESHAVAWIPVAEIERYAIDDSVRRLVAKTPALVSAA
jgi:8-oxo-dGTP pyrophosphatase MutT (NUDIX family)